MKRLVLIMILAVSCLISYGQTDTQQSSYDLLKETILDTRAQLPQDWGDGMILTEVHLEDNNFCYVVKVEELLLAFFKTIKQEEEEAMLNGMVEGIFEEQDFAQKLFLECIVAAKVGIKYIMWSENSVERVTFTVPSDMIIAAYDELNGNVAEPVVEEEPMPFQLIDEKPTFKGGDANTFATWVNTMLVYPAEAKENGMQGRVVLQFVIEKDGSVADVKVLRGAHPSLDAEAVRVVSSSPKWTPGKMNGKAVRVTYTFPVIFMLGSGK